MLASRVSQVIFASILAFALLPAQFAVAQTSTCTQLASGPLNLRSGPTTSANVLAVIPAGEVVIFNSQSADWIEVTLDNGLSGWASAEFLGCTTTATTQTETESADTELSDEAESADNEAAQTATTPLFSAICTVDADVNVNLRDAPTLDGNWIATLNGGATAGDLGLDDSGDWRQLELADGSKGWSNAAFLTCVEQEVVAPEVVEPTATPIGANFAGSHGMLCVYAYKDQNGNRMYDAGTEGVPQAVAFTIRDSNVEVAPSAEEGCFTVTSGNHVIDLATSASQQPDEGASWLVSVPVDRKMKLWVSMSEQEIQETISAEEMVQPTAVPEPTAEPINLTFNDYRNAVPMTWWRYIIGSAAGVFILALAALVVKLRGGVGKISDTDVVAMVGE